MSLNCNNNEDYQDYNLDLLEGFGSDDIKYHNNGNGKSKSSRKKNQPKQQQQKQNNKSGANKENGKKKKENKSKSEFLIYKYSQNGKGDLHESIIFNDLPFFIKYNKDTEDIELVRKIEENTRILRPPEREEYSYAPYEFSSKKELDKFITQAKTITLDEILIQGIKIWKRYVDQDEYIIILLVADSIWTYFQDLFSTTHYSEGVGTNDVGKSSIGYTFEYTGYRTVKATEISGPNYYRLLGSIEPAQCVIIEDEGDSISEDPDKVRILKSGYEYNGKVPKINMNSKNQEQIWFKTFCYKMILSEKSLSKSKARGLVDRTFSFYLRPGKVKYSIKEVVGPNINKNLTYQRLYDELIDFRKLMLCYRLVHYKDKLQEIETGLKNRDNELCKPLLQLFYGTKALKEIIKTLKIFVKQRREIRGNSLEATLYPIIKKIVFEEKELDSAKSIYSELKQKNKTTTIQVTFSKIWWLINLGAIDGNYDENKPNQYETVAYGTLYKNTLSKFIVDKFGARLDKKSHGSVLIFDIDKLERFEDVFGDKIVEDIQVEVKPVVSIDDEEENENTDESHNNGFQSDDKPDGYDGYDGSGKCVVSRNIYFETKNKHNLSAKKDISSCKEKEKEKDNMHLAEPSEPSLPSSSITDNLNNLKSIINTSEIQELQYSISPSLYKDVLSLLEKEINLLNRELIIYNAKNIKRKSPHSDIYVCFDKCRYSEDKWFMLKHPCRNFYKYNKEQD